MENAGDIIQAASRILKDPNMTHFTQSMLLAWASEGEREIARRTDCLQKQSDNLSSLMVADTIEQSLATLIPDTEVLAIFNVYAGTGTSIKALEPTTIRTLDRDWTYWRGRASGTPTDWYIGPNKTIGFVPPASSTWLDANGAWVVYSCLPTADLTDTNSVPQISKKAFDYIVEYVVLKGKMEDRELVTWDRLWQVWRDGLAFIKSEPRIEIKGHTGRVIPLGGVMLNPP